MKTQLSRDSQQPDKRYSGVYQQQGRMLTDADWNELVELLKTRVDEAIRDAVGDGVPEERGARIAQPIPSKPPRIVPGRVVADGVGADLRADATVPPAAKSFAYDAQADFPAPPALPSGGYTLYVDVWDRAVVSLEDDALRDPGLHGADTCTRTQTMAQVKWCKSTHDPDKPDVNPTIGDAAATITLRKKLAKPDPCDPCADEVDLEDRVGNYLFRVEAHEVEGAPKSPGRLILKWSSENGAEQHVVGEEPDEFTTGDWTWEFYAEAAEKHLGVHLATGFGPTRGKLLDAWPASPPAKAGFVRRWDGWAELKRTGTTWKLVAGRDRGQALFTSGSSGHGHVTTGATLSAELEALTLQLTLAGSSFVAGDHWLGVVREAVDAAGSVILDAAEPVGVRHRYVTLAKVSVTGKLIPPPTDEWRRLNFPPLTDLRATHVGYDTGCTDGFFTAKHDTVRKALDRICDLTAADVDYVPGCDLLSKEKTVQDALDKLCDELSSLGTGGGCKVTVGKGGQFDRLEHALEKLIEFKDICICMLAGEHEIDGPAASELLSIGKKSVKICGCGPGTRLKIKGGLAVKGQVAVTLESLLVQVEPGTSMSFFSCQRVTLDHCFIGGKAGKDGLVHIAAAQVVRVSDCEIMASSKANALLLRTGADEDAILPDTTITDSHLRGFLRLYDGGKSRTLGMSGAQLKVLRARLDTVKWQGSGGRLCLSRNRITQIAIGDAWLKALKTLAGHGDNVTIPPVFRVCFLTDNRFDDGLGVLLGAEHAVTSNLVERHSADTFESGAVVGRSATYNGNLPQMEGLNVLNITVASRPGEPDLTNLLSIVTI